MPKVLPDNTSQHHDGNRFPKASDYGLTKGYTDAANYHSPDIFTAEREAVFKQSWLCVGQLKDLPENGDYIRKQIPVLDASIIVVRGNDGTVRAFYNHCTHRGVPLIEEENGNARSFRCPYHGWHFDNQGVLRGIPCEEDFPHLSLIHI